jgi:hypothetical protein
MLFWDVGDAYCKMHIEYLNKLWELTLTVEVEVLLLNLAVYMLTTEF